MKPLYQWLIVMLVAFQITYALLGFELWELVC